MTAQEIDYGSLKIDGYCTCGSACHVSSNPPQHARDIYAAFRDAHQGEGHAPCDSRTAADARRKQQREEERRWREEKRS